jgi:CubicO group peptidase (beta-lactamase class C family)
MQEVLEPARAWAPTVAIAAVGPHGPVGAVGDGTAEREWASVTKLVTTLAVLRAVDEGGLDLDEPAGPPGSTVRHLLAHASGLGFEGERPVSPPERTRIYSNPGFDLLGALLAERAGATFERVVTDAVLAPLGMARTRVTGRPSAGIHGPLDDLVRLARELLRPTLVSSATLLEARTVAFPGLAGVLPGVGRYDSLDWGLGFEIRDGKSPHWTGSHNAPGTYGHFGRSGTFLWVDPVARLACIALTDTEFEQWAKDAWPPLADAVLATYGHPRE